MSLLREIAGGEERREALAQTSMHELRADLIAEVEGLFGVLRGSMPGDPSYGVGDVTLIYESRQDAGKAWCSETQATLARYVPRLQGVRVTQMPGERLDLKFRIRIAGVIVLNGRRVPMEFQAAIDPKRAWSVA